MTDKIIEKMEESEKLYRELFEHMAEGYAYCQMHYKNDEAQDWTYIAVNSAFENLTGLKDVTGKRVSEVIPGLQKSDAKLFDIYSRVAQTGKSEKFETFVTALKMWFSVSVYCPKKGFFVAVFDVITERKKMEDEMRKRLQELEIFCKASIGREKRMIELKNEIEILKKELKK